MAKIEVHEEMCKGCGLCVSVCPKQIIQLGTETNSKGYRFAKQINAESCIACKMCAVMCPDAVIDVYK